MQVTASLQVIIKGTLGNNFVLAKNDGGMQLACSKAGTYLDYVQLTPDEAQRLADALAVLAAAQEVE